MNMKNIKLMILTIFTMILVSIKTSVFADVIVPSEGIVGNGSVRAFLAIFLGIALIVVTAFVSASKVKELPALWRKDKEVNK